MESTKTNQNEQQSNEMTLALAEINDKNSDGMTLLHSAAINGQADVVQSLLKSNHDVNAKNVYGSTPLHAAAFNGHLEMVKVLIAAGADVNAKTQGGLTPFNSSELNGHSDIVKVLMASGADANVKIKIDSTLSHGDTSSLTNENNPEYETININCILNWILIVMPIFLVSAFFFVSYTNKEQEEQERRAQEDLATEVKTINLDNFESYFESIRNKNITISVLELATSKSKEIKEKDAKSDFYPTLKQMVEANHSDRASGKRPPHPVSLIIRGLDPKITFIQNGAAVLTHGLCIGNHFSVNTYQDEKSTVPTDSENSQIKSYSTPVIDPNC